MTTREQFDNRPGGIVSVCGRVHNEGEPCDRETLRAKQLTALMEKFASQRLTTDEQIVLDAIGTMPPQRGWRAIMLLKLRPKLVDLLAHRLRKFDNGDTNEL